MKRTIVLIFAVMLMLIVSCTAADKKMWSQRHSYKDPQMVGGYWDVTMQTGQIFSHVRCLYWGTDDDTAVFEMDNGRIVCQSGACVCVYVGDR